MRLHQHDPAEPGSALLPNLRSDPRVKLGAGSREMSCGSPFVVLMPRLCVFEEKGITLGLKRRRVVGSEITYTAILA